MTLIKDGYVTVNGQRLLIDGPVWKIIREQEGRYCVYSEDGSRSFGCYDSMQGAQERLRQIHYFETTKAEDIREGDHVMYAVSKPPDPLEYAHGIVDRVERDGTVTLPGTDESEAATPDDPVAVITVYADTEDGFVETDRRVARPFSQLRVSQEPLTKQVSDEVMQALTDKAEAHNDEVGDAESKRTTARTLVAVFERGVGAYRTNPGSVRPSVTSAEQWGYGRVNGFLHALKTGRFKRTPFDTDLLPKGHPLSTKAAELDEGSFVTFDTPEGPVTGQIEHVMRDGSLGLPGSGQETPASPENPVYLVRIWEQTGDSWAGTDMLVGRREGTVTPTAPLTKQTYKPPAGVQEAAQRALDWIREGHAGSGFTSVGRARAAQLARGGTVSESVIRRMHSYFARHEVDRQATGFQYGEKGYPSPGRVAWDAWGGDPGKAWVRGIVDDLKMRQRKQACPRATQDITLNLTNRQHAIDTAMYGPLNPDEPSTAFWEEISQVWEIPIEDAKKSRCGNCAAFDVTPGMRDCIAEGLGPESDPYDVIEAGELGYCHAFDFKCAAARTCSAWIAGGPIKSFIRKAADQRFTLGPLYVPDFMDAHGEWTDSEELQTAVWEWVRSGDRRIFLQHDTGKVAGEWVEVMTMPQAWTVDMMNERGETVGEVTYPPNTVFLGVIWDEETWPLVRDGKLRGYSIGGQSNRMMADLPPEAEREGIELHKHLAGKHNQQSGE